MGHSKEVRRGDLMSRGDTYKVPLKLSQGELDQCCDLGKYDVFAGIFPEYSHLFRTSAVFANEAAWPQYFFGLAGRQWISDGAGGELTVRLIVPSEIPMVNTNARITYSATQPVFWLSDHKIIIRPTNISIHLDHFLFPTPLADPLVEDAATDSMPEFSESAITRSAFEFALKMLVDQKQALEMNQQEIAHAEQTLRTLYNEKFQQINNPPELS